MDLIGDVCPVPLLKTERRLKELKVGDVLVVETEHSRAARNIQDWARKQGYEAVVGEVGNGIWEVRIGKTH